VGISTHPDLKRPVDGKGVIQTKIKIHHFLDKCHAIDPFNHVLFFKKTINCMPDFDLRTVQTP
jgi:hypothetical protein